MVHYDQGSTADLTDGEAKDLILMKKAEPLAENDEPAMVEIDRAESDAALTTPKTRKGGREK